MSVTYENHFQNHHLNPTKKGAKGFFTTILLDILRILNEAKILHTNPRLAHFVIYKPNSNALKHLHIYIKRWLRARDLKQGKVDSTFRYLAVREVRPRNNEEHIHLAVILDGTTSKELYKLETYLSKLTIDQSEDNVKLYRRKLESKESGASNYWHSIQEEFEDAFNRFSYLAKVFSKSLSNLKPEYICSRPI